MPRDERTRVLDPGFPLEQRLSQVTDLPYHREHSGNHHQLPQLQLESGLGKHGRGEEGSDHKTAYDTRDAARSGLSRTHRRRQLRSTEGAATEHGGRIADPGHYQREEHQPRTSPRAQRVIGMTDGEEKGGQGTGIDHRQQ